MPIYTRISLNIKSYNSNQLSNKLIDETRTVTTLYSKSRTQEIRDCCLINNEKW